MGATACWCAFAALVNFAPAQSDDLSESLGALVSRTVGSVGIGGLSISVDVGGDVLFEGGYGYLDAGQRETVAANSRWRAGALIGPLSALAVLRLAEDGDVDLDAPLARVFEELDLNGGELTLARVLSHSSGLPSYVEWLDAAREDTPIQPDAILAWIPWRGLEAAPGTCFEWSSTNVLLAGLTAERLSGVRLSEHLAASLFDPLGLEATTFGCDAPLRRAYHASWEFAGGLQHDDHALLPFGAEGLCTSAPDLVRLVRALVERKLFGEATWRRLSTPVRLVDGTEVPHGLGFGLGSLEGRGLLSFGGGFGGVRYHVAHYPAFDLTVALLATGEETPLGRLERDVARLLFDLPGEERVDLEVPPERVAAYLGDYWYACTRLQILEREGRLWLIVPGDPDLALAYQGRHRFTARDDPEVRLEFEVEGRRAEAFTLESHGTSLTARRME